MRLALQTDYALRSLIYLGTYGGRSQITQISQFFKISSHHVAKAVNRLAHEGFIRTVRGVGGGIELARAAHEIVLGDVIRRMEGNLHLLECVSGVEVCSIQPGCRLRHVLAEAERLQWSYLNSVRLSDVLGAGHSLVELLPLGDKPSVSRTGEV